MLFSRILMLFPLPGFLQKLLLPSSVSEQSANHLLPPNPIVKKPIFIPAIVYQGPRVQTVRNALVPFLMNMAFI